MAKSLRPVLLALSSIYIALSVLPSYYCDLQGQPELIKFQRDHTLNNSLSDLIFLVDVSGSLRYYSYTNGRYTIKNGFDDEKFFVNSLLNYIRVSLPTTRVSVILFSSSASININYISNLSPNNHKCNFKKSFNKLPFLNGMTNMNQAFAQAKRMLFGDLSGNKRMTKQVKTAVFLLTDGNWNVGGSPYAAAKEIRDDGVEVFAIGVTGGVDFRVLTQIASPGRAFRYSGFAQFRELAYYLRGGK